MALGLSMAGSVVSRSSFTGVWQGYYWHGSLWRPPWYQVISSELVSCVISLCPYARTVSVCLAGTKKKVINSLFFSPDFVDIAPGSSESMYYVCIIRSLIGRLLLENFFCRSFCSEYFWRLEACSWHIGRLKEAKVMPSVPVNRNHL